jgi:uncharacterized protein (TIGR00290 family)
MQERAAFCWSGGKDSALALYHAMRDERYDVVSLLTTCSREYERVSMHGVRIELARAQARAIGLPIETMYVGASSTNGEYERAMGEHLRAYQAQGVTAMIFGDIFLEDLRIWREEKLATAGMRGIFPLWKRDTRELVEEFIDLGFGSIVCCVNDAYLGEAFVGRTIDRAFVEALPPDVDPCGENGEFHSFAFAGPIFSQPLRVDAGEHVYRPLETPVPPSAGGQVTKGFWFCDLLLP